MPTDAPPILDLDVLRASAAKFREMQAALDARGRSLDELESRLESERINLGGQVMAIESVRAALRRDRERVAQTRVGLDQDAAALQADRLESANQQLRLQEMVPALEERDRLLQEAETRLAQRSEELAGRVQKSEARLRMLAEREQVTAQRERELEGRVVRLTAIGEAIALHEKRLAEREAEFVRRQEERLAALESREQQSAAFCDALTAQVAEATQRTASYADMRVAIEEEIDSVAIARESAAAEGEWLREAQAILTGTVESEGTDTEEGPQPAECSVSAPPSFTEAVRVETAPLEFQTAPVAVASAIVAEPETKTATTKEGAVGRLAQAIEAWEQARAAGWNVAGLGGPAKSARRALASGDYDGAMQLAATILSRIQAKPSPL